MELKMTKFARFLKDESGATAIEYALIAVAMCIALVTVMPLIAGTIQAKFSSIAMHLSTGA